MKVFIVFRGKTVYGVYMSAVVANEQALKASNDILFNDIPFHIEEHTVSELGESHES
tara:strand:- start:267 stop:437 length:171 start_codon:yes stop_codon:yes gene_type:complete